MRVLPTLLSSSGQRWLCCVNNLRRGVTAKSFATRSSLPTGWSSDVCGRPLDELQEHLQVPVSSVVDILFEPTDQEILECHRMFQPDRMKRSVLAHKAEIFPDRLPDTHVPEIAFIGRSNVGKSSLIKGLFHDIPEVDHVISVSKKPGHTRSIKLYKLKELLTLVDLPGYGYNMPPRFVQTVEGYLSTRPQLNRIFLLIDGKIGFGSADFTAIDMLEQFGRPYSVIFTKIDKSSKHRILNKIAEFNQLRKEKSMNCCFPQPFLVSSIHGCGLPFLQTFIVYITGNIEMKPVQS